MQRTKSLKIYGLLMFVLLGMNAFSQHNTTSPYSRFGIGDIVSSGKGRSVGMGGVGLALNSPYMLNSLNPASYGRLDSMSFIFDIGIVGHSSNFKSGEIKSSAQDANFDYFAMAFPVTSWWKASLGLNPYSNVGYSMKSNHIKDGNIDYVNTLKGKGGLNKAYISQSFIPVKNLYLGVNFSYVFGQIERTNMVEFAAANMIGVNKKELLTIKDVMFDFGFQYKKPLNKNYTLSVGGIYAPKRNLSTEYDLTSGSRKENGDIDFNLPSKFGGGLGLHYKDKFIVGFDYVRENWSDVSVDDKAKIFLGEGEFKNNETYALGFEYIPNKRSLRSYFDVVSYRLGVHYADSYLKIDGESVDDYGISLGLGFPLRRSTMYVNVALDLGRRGNNTIVEEDYAKLSVSFSIFSKWFFKQKYE